jgi:hypothetical protein
MLQIMTRRFTLYAYAAAWRRHDEVTCVCGVKWGRKPGVLFSDCKFCQFIPCPSYVNGSEEAKVLPFPPVSGLYGVYKEKGLIPGTLKSQLAADAYGDVLQLYQGAYDLPPELDTTVS